MDIISSMRIDSPLDIVMTRSVRLIFFIEPVCSAGLPFVRDKILYAYLRLVFQVFGKETEPLIQFRLFGCAQFTFLFR